MKFIHSTIFIFGFLLFSVHCKAQFIISYPSSTNDLTVCQAGQTFRVRLDVVAATADDSVSILLPPGVSISPISLTTNSANGMTISFASVNGQVIKFSLGAGPHSIGQFIDFEFIQFANCAARTSSLGGGNFKNEVTAYGTGGSVSEINPAVNSYNIQFPSIVLTAPPAINNATSGTSYTRNFSITNGAATCTNGVRFYLVYSGGVNSLNSITFNGISQSPSAANGDTLFFNLTGALCNGQSINIVETFTVNTTCSNITSYGSYWGCGTTVASACQLETTTALVTPAVGIPNYTSFSSGIVSFINKCNPITVFHTFTNGGTGDPTQAGMYNVSLSIGQGPYSATQGGISSAITMSNFTIGGNLAPNISVTGSFAQGSLEDYYSFDPDGPGGLEDLDGDGFFDDLAGGQSFTVNSIINFKCTGNLVCGSNEVNMWVQNGKLRYDNICGEFQAPENKWSNGYGHYEWAFNPTGQIPANISPSTPFMVTLNAGWYINNSVFNTPNTVYQWNMTLPPGVSIAPTANPTYGGAPTTYTQVGNVVTITSTNNTFGPATLNLIYTCGGGGTISIPYTLDKINDLAAGCFCDARLVCGTFETYVLCNSGCTVGTTSYIPKIERSDFALGWTTPAMTVKQARSSISTYDLSKALYLDTVLITIEGKQIGNATNMHLELELNKAGSVNKLSPVSVFVSVYRGGALLNQGNITLSSGAYSTPIVQSIDWDITSIFTGGVLPDDSVVTVARYVVATNNGLPLFDVQSGKWIRYYNLVGATKTFCNQRVPEMYLTGTYILDGTNPFGTSGCNAVGLPDYLARRFSAAGQYYQNEYRPVIYLDSFDITLNSNYTLQSVDAATWLGANTSFAIPTPLPGNVYRFRNSGSVTPLLLTVENTYGGSVNPVVRATCATDGTEIINRKYYIRDFYYAHQGLPTPPVFNVTLGSGSSNTANNPGGVSTNIAYNASTKPNIDLANQTGVINAYTNTIAWNVRVNSVGATIAPYVWLAIPNSVGINVNSIVDIATSTVIAGTPYPGGKIYQISTAGIASGVSRDYAINATLASCFTDSIKVYSGWNCGSYPLSPQLYTCSKDSVYLKVIPQNTSTQIALTTTPPNPISACTPLNYQAKIQNVGGANFRNTHFVVTVPNGLAMGTMEAEYPSGSGIWVAVPAVITGSNYSYDVSSVSNYPLAGIPGTVLAAANTEREVNVRWTFTVECDFASGSSFQIKTYSDNPCGSVVQGSNVPINSSTIQISGVTSPYVLATSTTISSPNLNCNSLTTINTQSTVVGGTTSSNATLKVILPAGFTYDSGSLVAGINPPTFSSTTTIGGIQTINFILPAGVASGSTINYSFRINGSIATVCGSNPVLFQSFEQTSSISCITEPSGFCASSQVQTESYSTSFSLLKPTLAINSSTSYQNAYNSNQYFTFYTIQNVGTTALTAGNPFTVNYYCADGIGNPTGGIISSNTHAANIAVNGSLSFSDTLPNPCGNLQSFVAVISNTTNCLCNQTTKLYAPIVNLGVQLVYFDVEKSGDRSAKANWQTNSENNTDFFEVERSTNLLNWKVIGTKQAAGYSQNKLDYSLSDNSVSSGLYYYRLKQYDSDGKFEIFGPQTINFGDINTIHAVPNPSGSGIFTLMGVSDNAEITVFDSKGKIVFSNAFKISNVIDLSVFDSGIYVARVVEGESVTTLRLVRK